MISKYRVEAFEPVKGEHGRYRLCSIPNCQNVAEFTLITRKRGYSVVSYRACKSCTSRLVQK